MFGKSGKYLLLMTYWWILPFLVISLSEFPLWANLPSYYTYFIPFIITGIFSFLCGLVETQTDWWSRAGFWKRYLALNGLYISNIFLIIFVTITLHNYRMLRYFGGDAEGSFGLLYPYTIVFYLLVGIFLGLGKHFRRAWISRGG
jgi:hypothetical protein